MKLTRHLTCLIALLIVALPATGKPFAVHTDISIRQGNWYPLSVEDMKSAATDTALAEISRGGLFRLIHDDASMKKSVGLIRLEISLIGPAETAKLTIELNLPDKSTYVSTASISVRNLDHQGIYRAFEHIGKTAAQRLNDKTEALLVEPPLELARAPEPKPEPKEEPPAQPAATDTPVQTSDDPNLRAAYDQAQRLKRQYQYKKARILFEQVAAASGSGDTRLGRLARDELRYGLTVFEAQQRLVATGRLGNNPGDFFEQLRKTENLYRQILAENVDSFTRTQEAQQSLDQILVTRNAYKNALSSMLLNKATGLRIGMLEYVQDRGDCPPRKYIEELLGGFRTTLSLEQIDITSAQSATYIFTDKELAKIFASTDKKGATHELALICEDYDVRLAQSQTHFQRRL